MRMMLQARRGEVWWVDFLVNPHDIEGMADAIHRAVTMPAEERRSRMRRLRRTIRKHDVFWWVDSFLRAAIARDLSTFAPSEDYLPQPVQTGQLAGSASRIGRQTEIPRSWLGSANHRVMVSAAPVSDRQDQQYRGQGQCDPVRRNQRPGLQKHPVEQPQENAGTEGEQHPQRDVAG
jgi:Glycosyltransferase family 20